LDFIVARSFNSLYVFLDIGWLIVLAILLLSHRRYLAVIVGLVGCVIYFAVDYGYFYHILGTRQVTGASTFWVLLWLSTSYGFTNFAWIWLLLDRDGHAIDWSVLIISGWLAVALLSQNFGANFTQITISRGTADYHGGMTAILFIGYLWLVILNLRASPKPKINLLWLVAIGIGVQFSWEAVLLLTGIRPMGITPLIVDSLIETNLGMPYLYLIHQQISSRFDERLRLIR
jgi:hypothetical protein